MTLPPPPPPMPSSMPQNNQNQNPHMLEANGRYGKRSEPPFLIIILNIINAITQLMIGAVALSAFFMANLFGYSSSLSQHIYLCVFGYIILMSQAILTYNSHAGWAYSLRDQDKKLIHGAMQILGSILAISGSIVRIVDLDVHFNTAHAVMGIVAMILTFFSLIGGLLNFIIPLQTSSFLYQALHMCIGCLTISVAFICLCLGFNGSFSFIFGSTNSNLSISLAVFALAGILISAFTRTAMKMMNGE